MCVCAFVRRVGWAQFSSSPRFVCPLPSPPLLAFPLITSLSWGGWMDGWVAITERSCAHQSVVPREDITPSCLPLASPSFPPCDERTPSSSSSPLVCPLCCQPAPLSSPSTSITSRSSSICKWIGPLLSIRSSVLFTITAIACYRSN